MSHFVILITKIEGVDLVLRALRSTSCIASHDLAEGIENNLCWLDDKGVLTKIENPIDKEPEVIEKKKPQPFSIVKADKE